ncbi:MAG: hypothetical protein ACR2FQ_12825 [Pseudonocardiaceae bacterium]
MTQPPYPPSGPEPEPYPQQGYPQQPYPGQSPSPGQPPKEVELSFRLWIASIVVSLLGSILTFATIDDIRQQTIDDTLASTPGADPQFIENTVNVGLIVGLVFGLALLALEVFFIVKMRAGRNWARIVLTVLGALGVISGLFSLGQPGLTALTSGLSALILIAAIVTMYLPGAAPWFRQPLPSQP